MNHITSAGSYYLPEGEYVIDRHFQMPDGATILGAGIGKTIITASKAVFNGCGRRAQVPGNSKTRIGFLLAHNTKIGHFTFVSKDKHRWQGYGGAALCGGGVFETPGCADAYCHSENIGDWKKYGNGGVGNVTVENVKIEGSSSRTAPQLAVFVTQTRDLSKPSHDIVIRGIEMGHSFADGINLHGAVHNALVENCNLYHQGDDNLAVWSHKSMATNITFRNNTLDQTTTENPHKWWGNCVALYGGGEINVINTRCRGTNGVGVKFAVDYGGEWSRQTRVVVEGMVTNHGKPACWGMPRHSRHMIEGCKSTHF